jgi:adenylylsulfate reductase subunit A
MVPIFMRTEEAIQENRRRYSRMTQSAYKKKTERARGRSLGRLPRYDHLPGNPLGRTPTCSLKRSPSEIAAAEPYFIGSHSGASGAWVSGPKDLQTAETESEYFWGYE